MAEKMYNRGTFKFVGEPVWGRSNVLTTEKLKNSKYNKTRLNFGVKVENNAQFLSTEYIFENKEKIRLFDKNRVGFDVNWNETKNIENLNKLNPASLMTINLETDQEVKKNYYSILFKRISHEKKKVQTDDDKKKIAEYTEELKKYSKNVHVVGHIKDFIDIINNNKDLISQYKIKITGSVKSNYYKEENRLQYIPKVLELVLDEQTPELTLNLDFFFEKDGFVDDKKERKSIIQGYIGEYIKEKDRLFPLSLTFDYSKTNTEDPKHMELVKFMKGFFINVSSKKSVYKLPVICTVVNGSEVVSFDESMLTNEQKMCISLGLNSIDDFKPRGNTYGDRVSFIKLKQPNLKEAKNGTVEAFLSEDLIKYLQEDDSDISIDKVDKDNEKDEPTKDNEDLINSLFG